MSSVGFPLSTLFNIFKIFGFIPYSTHNLARNKMLKILSHFTSFLVLSFLIVYWSTIALFFFDNEAVSDRFSLITNWIQLVVNGLTLTIILAFPLTYTKIVSKVFMQINKFDARVVQMGGKIDGFQLRSFTLVSILIFMSFMVYSMVYEGYVVMVKYDLCGGTYWTISIIPGVVYSAALCFAFCFLLQILYRVKLIEKILKCEAKFDEKFQGIFPKLITLDIEQSVMSNIPSVFHLYSQILEISGVVNDFLGPFFLASFTSIFVVTTTQIYHCYVLVVTPVSEINGFSSWTFVVCVNVIVGNVLAMVGVIALCENINNEVRKYCQICS